MQPIDIGDDLPGDLAVEEAGVFVAHYWVNPAQNLALECLPGQHGLGVAARPHIRPMDGRDFVQDGEADQLTPLVGPFGEG